MDRNANENTQSGNTGGTGRDIPGLKGSMSGIKGPDAKVASKDRTASPGKLPKDPQAPHGDPGDGAD